MKNRYFTGLVTSLAFLTATQAFGMVGRAACAVRPLASRALATAARTDASLLPVVAQPTKSYAHRLLGREFNPELAKISDTQVLQADLKARQDLQRRINRLDWFAGFRGMQYRHAMEDKLLDARLAVERAEREARYKAEQAMRDAEWERYKAKILHDDVMSQSAAIGTLLSLGVPAAAIVGGIGYGTYAAANAAKNALQKSINKSNLTELEEHIVSSNV
jgi:hypothetical protein